MRKLLVALAVIAVIAVVGDFLARNVAEDRVAGRLQRTFDLSDEPSVSFRGFPFLLNVARGDIPAIVMTGDEVRSEDLALHDVEVEMRHVRFSLSDVVDGSGRVTAAGGDGSATIREGDLNDALTNAGAPFTLRVDSSGVSASAEGGVEAGVDVSVSGGTLSIGSTTLPAVSVHLPSLGGKVAYESVDLGDDLVTLRFSVENVALNT